MLVNNLDIAKSTFSPLFALTST